MADIASIRDPGFLYDAFISYRHVERDRAWAEWLIEALERYRVPRSLVAQGYPARLRKVFRDEDEMPASGDLNEEIKRALSDSRWLIVICSPYTPRSKWVEREIEMFRELGRGNNVLALLTEGEPHDAFPTSLLERHRVIEKPDGSREIVQENAEPLAADVRPRKGVTEAATKQQALLRLVAPLLGVSFDALRQREKERQRKSMQFAFVASSALLTMGAGGAIAYWDFARPKTAYYRDFVWRYGLPVGIGPVDDETRARRETSIAVVSERGRPVEVRHENSAGILRDHLFENEEIARCRIEYRLDGEADRLACFDRFDRYSYHMRYRRDGDRLIVVYERNGAPMTQRATGSLLEAQHATGQTNRERSEITGLAIKFDANGFVAEQRFLDPWGVPRQDAEGAWGSRFVNSPTGLVLRRTKIAADGADLVGRTGVAAVSWTYDVNSLQVSEMLIGTDGLPTSGTAGFSGIAKTFDRWGNRTEVKVVGSDGGPVIGVEGYARVTARFDDRGNVVEVRYFDVEGRPIDHKRSGCARLTSAFDSRGNRTEQTCFDASGAPIVAKDGFHRYTNTYDSRDRWIEWAYFGTDGRPVLHKDGMARQTFTYDARGFLSEIAYFGVDGRPIARGDGIARRVFENTELGDRIAEAHFGIDGRPTLSRRTGVARIAWTLDARGNQTEVVNTGIDGRPILNRAGFARVAMKYDTRGHVVERRAFGDDGRPVIVAAGWSTITFVYDERGRAIGRSYFGIDGAPIETGDGCARWSASVDERGNRTEVMCFGVDGRPRADREGCAVTRRTFDMRGNATSIACIGGDGAPALNRFGHSRMTARYDERGNVLHRAFFGVDGRATLHKVLGAASVQLTYDARGNLIQTIDSGVDGQPVLNSRGYSKSTASYDARGYQISEAFFGVNGEPVMQRGVFARVERTFDERGDLVSARYFDAAGRQLTLEIAVANVRPGSNAAKAGVAISDRVISYDRSKILAINQLATLAKEAGFGVPHSLTIRRGIETMTLMVAAGDLGVTVTLVAPGVVLRPQSLSPRIATDDTDGRP
ncbi:MAG: TIR domain-containing protein [Hyphomicrobiaceae bacterium]